MFSLTLQEKLRKPIIGISGVMHRTGMAGLWLRFVSASHRFILWRSPFIKSLKATCIFDIGANSGEFALLARTAFPTARIVCFEPHPEAFSTLTKVMRMDKHFQAFQVALGEKEESGVMHLDPFSPNSSFTNRSSKSIPQKLQIQKLDSYEAMISNEDQTILKLDVEGYELAILKGAENFITKTDYIYIECRTTDPIGCTFVEIYAFLVERGWEYQGAYDSVYTKTGKLLYFDALFKNVKRQNLI